MKTHAAITNACKSQGTLECISYSICNNGPALIIPENKKETIRLVCNFCDEASTIRIPKNPNPPEMDGTSL